MKTQHKLLTVEEVVQILVDKEVISEKVAEALLSPRHWTIETPLVEDGPTMLFEDLVNIAGYELHYQENMEIFENEYWLTKLEN
ncbi:TPA: hypothetical protein QFK61_002368 [Enterococcus faecium]|uniref:hypothetical protein n=1 Tax=Enterococcus TaxID=1350 RepID=UPI0009BE091F|nr:MULTISPECIES: hypothetical protein [Enterococcus]EMF0042422.1 hypothetical protein [Enterococcus hirae]EMF0137065.1 hypothetical protein [Enterococcus hirae]EMF0511246.1 hypothetical protein [Enterococcus hirae]EMF0621765.1 hypothetical protein [Enterococcus hirae]NDK21515.1 hypothetical protein [Enterococcus faecium]